MLTQSAGRILYSLICMSLPTGSQLIKVGSRAGEVGMASVLAGARESLSWASIILSYTTGINYAGCSE